MRVVPLPVGKYLIVFDRASVLPDKNALADWLAAVQRLEAKPGCAGVLRFTHEIDINELVVMGDE